MNRDHDRRYERSAMPSTHRLPRWLKPFNRVVMTLNRLGFRWAPNTSC